MRRKRVKVKLRKIAKIYWRLFGHIPQTFVKFRDFEELSSLGFNKITFKLVNFTNIKALIPA